MSLSTTSPSADPKLDKILAAAREVFLEHGYAAASMDVVAKQARASKTTLYTRFPSKEALFAATIARECERSGMFFQAEEFDGLELEAALFEIGRRFLGLIWSPAALRLHQIILGEAARFPEVARTFYESGILQTSQAASRFFQRAAQQGRVTVADPVFAAQQFMVTLKGFPDCGISLGLHEPPPPAARDEYLAKAIALFLGGCR